MDCQSLPRQRFRRTAALFELNAFVFLLHPVPSESLEMLNCNPGKAQHSHMPCSSAQKKLQWGYPLKFTSDEGPVPSLLACLTTVSNRRGGKALLAGARTRFNSLLHLSGESCHWEPHFSHASPSHPPVFNNLLSLTTVYPLCPSRFLKLFGSSNNH